MRLLALALVFLACASSPPRVARFEPADRAAITGVLDRQVAAWNRGDLTAYLRAHYGTVGWHPWKRPPYPTSVRNDDMDKAEAVGALSPMPKWGYGPQVK